MTTHTITVNAEGNGRVKNPHTYYENDMFLSYAYIKFKEQHPEFPAPGLKPGEYSGAKLQWQYKPYDDKTFFINCSDDLWELVVPGAFETRQIWVLESSTIEQAGEEKTPQQLMDRFLNSDHELIKSILSEFEDYHIDGPTVKEYFESFSGSPTKIAELKAENQRLRKALEEICDANWKDGSDLEAVKKMYDIATNALKPKE